MPVARSNAFPSWDLAVKTRRCKRKRYWTTFFQKAHHDISKVDDYCFFFFSINQLYLAFDVQSVNLSVFNCPHTRGQSCSLLAADE